MTNSPLLSHDTAEYLSNDYETSYPPREDTPDPPVTHIVKRPKRCLVYGVDTQSVRTADDLEIASHPDEPYDVIIIGGLAGRRWLADTIKNCRNPLAPIVLIADDPLSLDGRLQRFDLVVNSPGPEALGSAMQSLSPLISRVSSLPDIPPGPDRTGLIALAMAHTRNRPIEPVLTPLVPHGVDYPLLPQPGNQRRILEELANAGLLRARFFDRLYLCEHCESPRIHAREGCVSCQSSHLVEAPIVHHYPCGFQAPQPSFEQADGYRCPKCRKALCHYGVDYDKPGIVVTCQDCQATMAEPDTFFLCFDCGKQTPSEKAKKVDWYRYDITPDGIATLRQMKLPSTGEKREAFVGYSPRDFRLLAAQHLQLCEQFDRPISFWTMEVDHHELEKTIGHTGAAETLNLLREVASGELRSSDFATFLPSRAVVCLPETDERSAQAQIRHVEKRIKKTLRPAVDMTFRLLGPEDARPLLQELR